MWFTSVSELFYCMSAIMFLLLLLLFWYTAVQKLVIGKIFILFIFLLTKPVFIWSKIQ